MSAAPAVPRSRLGRRLVLIGAGAALTLLVAANAHLVYVAFTSQPACVPHAKVAGDNGAFRAARPSC